MNSTEAITYRPARGAAKLEQKRLLQRAVELLREKQLDPAEQILETVLERWPHQPDALHFLGVLQHTRGDSEAALRLIWQATQVEPNEPGPWNNLGNVLVESEQFTDAEKAYRQCLDVQPGFVDALSNLATIHTKRGLHTEAEALCRRAIEAKPDFGQAWYNLSVSLLAQDRIAEGLEANSRAILLWPKHLQARDSVVRALVYLGRLDEAAQLYREWLESDPENPVIRHHLAACLGEAAPARASDAYVERTFDAFAATFDANLAALGYRAPQWVAALLRELRPSPSAQLDIVDLGCGTGLCGPLVREWAKALSGCDLSAGMLEKAQRRRIYDSLHHAELIAHLNANQSSFDVLLCADTLCYFGDLAEVSRAAAGAMRLGGHFIFTVEALQNGANTPHRLQPNGRYAHTREHIESALAAAGLTPIALRSVVLRLEAGKEVHGWLVAATPPRSDG